jgi:hypothetical protein
MAPIGTDSALVVPERRNQAERAPGSRGEFPGSARHESRPRDRESVAMEHGSIALGSRRMGYTGRRSSKIGVSVSGCPPTSGAGAAIPVVRHNGRRIVTLAHSCPSSTQSVGFIRLASLRD